MATATTKPNPALVPLPFSNRIVAVNSAPPDFDPARDLTHLYLGLYSMQGADLSGVALGKFDKAKIESAVSGVELSHSEAPANEGTSPSTGNSPWRADDIIMPRPLSLLMAILELLIAMVLLMAAFELPIDMLPGASLPEE